MERIGGRWVVVVLACCLLVTVCPAAGEPAEKPGQDASVLGKANALVNELVAAVGPKLPSSIASYLPWSGPQLRQENQQQQPDREGPTQISLPSKTTSTRIFKKVRPKDVPTGNVDKGAKLSMAAILGGGSAYLASLGITWTAAWVTPTLMAGWGGAVAAGSWTAFIQSVGAGATFLGGPVVWSIVGGSAAVGTVAWYMTSEGSTEESGEVVDVVQTLIVNGENERYEEWLVKKPNSVISVVVSFVDKTTSAAVHDRSDIELKIPGDEVDMVLDLCMTVLEHSRRTSRSAWGFF